jgi:hypothetical protein
MKLLARPAFIKLTQATFVVVVLIVVVVIIIISSSSSSSSSRGRHGADRPSKCGICDARATSNQDKGC